MVQTGPISTDMKMSATKSGNSKCVNVNRTRHVKLSLREVFFKLHKFLFIVPNKCALLSAMHNQVNEIECSLNRAVHSFFLSKSIFLGEELQQYAFP